MPTDDSEMSEIRDVIDNSITKEKQSVTITPSLIKQCLKPVKDIGDLGFKSDHLINSGYHFLLYCLLFNSMIVHGYAPTVLLKSTIVYIRKTIKHDYQVVIIIGEFLCLIVFVNCLMMCYYMYIEHSYQHQIYNFDLKQDIPHYCVHVL